LIRSNQAIPTKGLHTAPYNALVALHPLGVKSHADALLVMPSGYHDFTDISQIEDVAACGGAVTEPKVFRLTVTERASLVQFPKKRLVVDAAGALRRVRLVTFLVSGVDVSYWKALLPGQAIHVRGRLQNWGGRLQITAPEIVRPEDVGRIIARYAWRGMGKYENALRTIVAEALEGHLDQARDQILTHIGLPEVDALKQGGVASESITHLLQQLHAPSSLAQAQAAQSDARRLAALCVAMQARRHSRRDPVEGASLTVSVQDLDQWRHRLPFALTPDQARAMEDIIRDLASVRPMRRLLSADVGHGKTVTYALPAFAVRARGYLVVILMPNALLADQVATELQALAPDVPIRIVSGQRRLDSMQDSPILIGTSAVLNALAKCGAQPDLLIVDEQQKFGAELKRSAIAPHTNLLEATATAIPRTSALVTHGGMDVSVLQTAPVVRTVVTRIVEADAIARLFAHTREVLHKGGQVAVVYPAVQTRHSGASEVIAAFVRWDKSFPGMVGMVHGRLSENEKTEVINRFRAGELRILVSSVLIELGLTLPSLRSMVIVQPERLGVSMLHQLRGRLVRHGGIGFFFLLLTRNVSPEARARLELLVKCADGFSLALHDAQSRGYGDMAEDATRQHGASRPPLFHGLRLMPQDLQPFVVD
jgi:ATP-dependent DNA helicase RecG